MPTFISTAFYELCKEAKHPGEFYVSLYQKEQKYGGPEEGGWWRNIITLEASHKVYGEEQAEQLEEKIKVLAKEMQDHSRTEYGKKCLRETEWLEARGLDDSFLPEPDGPIEYFVVIEELPGQYESRGPSHYE